MGVEAGGKGVHHINGFSGGYWAAVLTRESISCRSFCCIATKAYCLSGFCHSQPHSRNFRLQHTLRFAFCTHKHTVHVDRSPDVEVPLTQTDGPHGLHGSVLGSGQAREWLQFLLGRQPKDSLLYLRKWVKEAARKEEVQLKSGRSKFTGRSSHDT